ncbi:hypothetical protein [Embleya sp. AB8]|uniref:hypothetical protein n=1 Tax=Embleya sp. AB8 TaxID=3156304 RepID=UPI003C78BA7F
MTLITLLVLTNVWNSGPGMRARHDGSAPSPADIPPQLPAQDQSVEATPAPGGGATPGPGGAPANGQPVPVPTITVTETTTAPAGSAGNTGSRPGGTSAAPGASGPSGGSGGGPPATAGGSGGSGGGSPTAPPPIGERFRVTDVRLVADRANGSYVRCNGLDQVQFIGTMLVDGTGEGDVVYQWIYDKVRAFPQDVMHFTGTGPRQQSVPVPWPIPAQLIGGFTGAVQLLILQPIANAQTKYYTFNFNCRLPFTD